MEPIVSVVVVDPAQINEHLAGVHAGGASGSSDHQHAQPTATESFDEFRKTEGNFLRPKWVPSELQVQRITKSTGGILNYWYVEPPVNRPEALRMTVSVATRVALRVPAGSFTSTVIAEAPGYQINGTWANSLDATGRLANARWDPNARRGITFERMGKAILIQASPPQRFSTDILIRIAESIGWDHEE